MTNKVSFTSCRDRKRRKASTNQKKSSLSLFKALYKKVVIQQEEIEHILTNICPCPNDITTLKTRVKGTILQILEEVDQCTSSSVLKQLEKQMTAAASLLVSLKSDKEQEVIPLKVKIKVNENSPTDKNMETQPRLYSTKKHCRKAKVRVTSPTYEEQQAFLRDMDENRTCFLCSLIDLVLGCLHVVSVAGASLVAFNNFNFLVFTSNLPDMEGGVREVGVEMGRCLVWTWLSKS